MWTRRIASRPTRSGMSTTIWRSKRPGLQQSRVQHVGAVGGRQQNDALVGLEAVHLHQQLVEGLFAFVVTAAEAGAAVASDRVDLIDEDDAGGVFLALVEEIADAAGADADEHLHEVRTAHAEERHAGFTGHRAAQQGLAGAGRSHQQGTLGNATAQALELLGRAQEVDDLLQFVPWLRRSPPRPRR